MKTELNCAIVRDLLPSYADGLTSEATTKMVEAHLKGCSACQAVCKRMVRHEEPAEATEHEVDFLKKQRKKARVLALVTALAVLLTAAMLWLIPSSFLGTELNADAGISNQVACAAEVEGDTLTLSGFLTNGNRFVRAKYRQAGDVLNVTLYQSESSPLRSGHFTLHHTLPEGVTEVQVMGITLWQDGVAVRQATGALFQSLSASMDSDGNSLTDEAIATQALHVLQLDQQLGATGWTDLDDAAHGTLSFHIFGSGVSASSDTTAARLLAMKNSALIFAAQPSVQHIVWSYDTVQATADADGTLGIAQEAQQWDFTPEEVCDVLHVTLGASDSCASFQQLLDALELPMNGVYDSALSGLNFSRLDIYQGTDTQIAGLSLRLYVDDRQTYETRLSPAGGIDTGTIETIDLPQSGANRWQVSVGIDNIGQSADVGDISNAWFTLCVLDEKGQEQRTSPMPVSLLGGRSYRCLLSGNAAEGYTLSAF